MLTNVSFTWLVILRWMDASLFFRGMTAVMDFLSRVAGGGFIAHFFVGEYDDSITKNSFFAKCADKLLNSFPKIFNWDVNKASAQKNSLNSLFTFMARLCAGSWFIGTACDALETPVLIPEKTSFTNILRWALHAAPVWGLLAVTAAVPFLPTMVLAGMLTAVFAFTLLRQRFIIEPVSISVLVFIFITLFSGVTSFHPASSIPIAVLSSVLMISFLLIVSLCHTHKQVDFFFFVFIASSMGAGLSGLYQYITKQVDMTWVDEELFAEIQLRVSATFGNPNVYATYLLLAIPLAAAMVLYVKKPLYRLLAFGVTGLLLFNLLFSYSRGCYLALAVSGLVFVLLVEKRLIILSAAGLIGVLSVLPPTVLNRLASITNLADSSTSYRIFIWQGTLRVLWDYWMTGLGQGIDAYNVVYPYYAFNAVVAPHSHNLLLQIFVETGIVGLLAFIAVIAWFFRCQARFLRHTKDWRNKIVSAAMVSAVIGFLFQGMFDYVFYNYRVMLVFFIFIGLACAFANSKQNHENMKREQV